MAVTVREAALVLCAATGVSPDAFWSPGPVLVDLPSDVQVAEIEFDPDMLNRCRSTNLLPAVCRSKSCRKC